MAKNIGLNGGKSLFISLEMPAIQLINRLFSSFGIKHDAIRSGKLQNDDWSKLTNATGQLMQSGIFVDDTPALSATRIDAIARKLFKKEGKMPIVLDYLQIMGSDTTGNRFEEVTAFSQKLKAIAKRHDVPVVLLSQLNRTCESRQDKRPITADLRESGAIEQDASTIMFLFRDEVYTKEKSAFKGEAELIIAKQRNGETGVVPLIFNGGFQRFETMSEMQEASFWDRRTNNDALAKRSNGLV
jgi:replicative DNA helicase